jgi:long-chain acyl-CoA synthetase
VFRKFNELGLDFVQGYGLTETSPIINLNPVEHYKETSVGRVVAETKEKILDPVTDGRGNAVGEVLVSGPMVMQGYFEMPEETADAFITDPDGTRWLKTGDVGYMDSEDYLYLTGRAKSMIVTEGGKNVYPEEIENEFQLYDEVEQVLVRGWTEGGKSNDKGEHIEALIYPAKAEFAADGHNADKEAIKKRINAIVSEVNTRLLPYQKIERVTVLDEPLEETTTKKIKR